MRPSSLPFLVAFLAVFAFAVSASFATEDIPPDTARQLVEDVAAGKLFFFETDPAFGAVNSYPISDSRSRIGSSFKSTGGYVVTLSGDRRDQLARLKFVVKRADGKPFKTLSYGIAIDTNAIACLKTAEFYRDGGNRTSANRNPPVVCRNNSDGCSVIVLGFADQVTPAEIHNDGDRLRMSRPASWESITAREIKDGVYLDLSKQYWFDALKAYAAYADKYRAFKPRPIPPQAYEPVWCSWYTLTTHVNEENIWENARIAKSLGIGTILVDAGWDTPFNVCMAENSTYGDRVAHSTKFPDLAGLVDRIHRELGLAVEVWASPWSIGYRSRADKEVNDIRLYLGNPPKRLFFLCPRCAGSGDFLARNISDVFRNYNVDGMWMDFLDSVPLIACKGTHKHDYQTHGEGYNAAMTKIASAVREVNPKALIEIRLGSSNINNKLFANVLETYDTPLGRHENRGLLVYVRTLADGCAPKTDPTMWQRSREEGKQAVPDDLVGRYMATMITVGVPAISQDLTKMSDSNRQVIRAYLDFYHAHKRDLMKGDFRPVGNGPEHPNFFVQGRKATYLYSATPAMPKIEMKRSTGAVYLFNGGDGSGISLDIDGLPPGRYSWVARDARFRFVSGGDIDVNSGGLIWNAPAPVGGTVELRRIPGR
ncbi:MAG: alpha-galactosidase [Armatimonadota bacterium]|nr:alpha-galactosidase [Armatimonadota bacterium]